jgi:hypothetical protein
MLPFGDVVFVARPIIDDRAVLAAPAPGRVRVYTSDPTTGMLIDGTFHLLLLRIT